MGGPRADESEGGSSGSPRCVRIFRIGPGSRTGSPQQPEVANSAKARDGFELVKQFERDQPDVTATTKGTRAETPRPPGPSAWPTQSATCRASGAFDLRHSSLPWRCRRSHARPSRYRPACRHSLLASAVTAAQNGQPRRQRACGPNMTASRVRPYLTAETFPCFRSAACRRRIVDAMDRIPATIALAMSPREVLYPPRCGFSDPLDPYSLPEPTLPESRDASED